MFKVTRSETSYDNRKLGFTELTHEINRGWSDWSNWSHCYGFGCKRGTAQRYRVCKSLKGQCAGNSWQRKVSYICLSFE